MIKYTHDLIKLQNLWSFRLFILFIVSLYPLFAKLLFMYSIYSEFIIFIVYFAKILFTEASPVGDLVKKVFLNILQNSHENRVRVSF